MAAGTLEKQAAIHVRDLDINIQISLQAKKKSAHFAPVLEKGTVQDAAEQDVQNVVHAMEWDILAGNSLPYGIEDKFLKKKKEVFYEKEDCYGTVCISNSYWNGICRGKTQKK